MSSPMPSDPGQRPSGPATRGALARGVAVLVLVAMPLLLPEHLTLGPGWILPAIGVLFLGFVVVADPEPDRRPGCPWPACSWLGADVRADRGGSLDDLPTHR